MTVVQIRSGVKIMYIEINTSSGLPIYLQIKNQIKKIIATSTLKPDDPLTSVRQLALNLRVNPNTIAKAYRELELEGVLYTKRGKGVFVARKKVNDRISKEEKMEAISGIVDQLAVEAFHLGVGKEEVSKLLKIKLDEFKRQ